MDRVVIDSCSATTGGGVYVGSLSNYLSIQHSVISNCTAEGTGGAIYLSDNNDYLTITNSTLAHNSASAGGGLFSFSNAHATITTTLFTSNAAISTKSNADGGAINLFDSNEDWKFVLCTFTYNYCPDSGGALWKSREGLRLSLAGSTFEIIPCSPVPLPYSPSLFPVPLLHAL
jgi:hypothetical protein